VDQLQIVDPVYWEGNVRRRSIIGRESRARDTVLVKLHKNRERARRSTRLE